MLYYGILFLNGLICVLLIGVVLLQRSEGGALGGGGSPSGLVTTRGAGDLLTRTTWVLFTAFLILSLSLTLLGGRERSSQTILNRLKLQSINPDTLKRPPAGASGEAAPGQATPPPVQAPAAAPKPSVRLPAATQAPPSAPAPGALDFSTPAPTVSLPPLPAAPTKQ
jgi:preprotein translocase subunit SecG